MWLLLLLWPFYTMAMNNEGAQYPLNNSPRIQVESSTRVLDSATSFIGDENECLVCESHKMVEVVLRIHRAGRPVKTITLNVDI